MLGQHFQTCGLILGGPLWSQDLDLMILVGPFQLRLFGDSKSAYVNQYENVIQFSATEINFSLRIQDNQISHRQLN